VNLVREILNEKRSDLSRLEFHSCVPEVDVFGRE